MPDLPNVYEMFASTVDELDTARNALSESTAWLRSDWRPTGSELTTAQAAARAAVLAEIATARGAIDRAKAALGEVLT